MLLKRSVLTFGSLKLWPWSRKLPAVFIVQEDKTKRA